MAALLLEETYEYLSDDGKVSEECLAGRAAFRAKSWGDRQSLWVAPSEEPNATTLAAMRELEDGHGQRYESTEALFEDLGI